MQFEVGDRVDRKTPGGTRPQGEYTVIAVDGRRVTIRDQSGATSVVDSETLEKFRRPGRIDWP